jgi:hypothetical protein
MRTTAELVALFVREVMAHPQAELSELAASLRSSNVDPETAECLMAFVPMAFAHVVLGNLGVALPTHFILWDPTDGKEARGALRKEPVFRTALAQASAMLGSGPDGVRSATTVASGSAEWNVVAQLTRNGSDPSACGLTEPVLMRLPLSYLSKPKPRSSWWRFWRAPG